MSETKKNLLELYQETEKVFDNFIYMIFYANPTRDNVRVIFDDGNIKLFMKRDRFLQLIESVTDFSIVENYNNYIKIKSAILSYGKWFLYDRNAKKVSELTENIDYEHIMPQDLLNETRKNMSNREVDKFNTISKQYEDQVMSIKSNPVSSNRGALNKIFSVVREINKKKNHFFS